MTFKEKLKQEHPEKLDNGCGGGCIGCPYDYGYEKGKPKGCKGGYCNVCWNREMPAPMTAEEAWELVQRLNAPMKPDEIFEFYNFIDVNGFAEIFQKYTPYEAKAKLEEWESRQIRVGDVITTMNGSAEHLVLRIEQNPRKILHVCNVANGTVQTLTCEVKKTGKHIDIQSVLEQIVKEE